MKGLTRRAFLKLATSSAVISWSPLLLAGGEAENLLELLEPIRARDKLPGLAAAVFQEGSLKAIGVTGFRRAGDEAQLTVGDKFHIGSCTKAMTATLAAVLVQTGLLSWTSTLEAVFPERAAKMHHLFRQATLEQLLTHRAGTPENGKNYGQQKEPVTEQRLAYMDSVLSQCPVSAPGPHFRYSNAGYIIAGAMLERRGAASWEELMRREIFSPLAMTSAGFGPPCASNSNDQPWGHLWQAGKFRPRHGDNPPALGPAGTVHCTLEDYLKFAELHATFGKSPPGLLSRESAEKMHTAVPGAEYGMGWGVCDRSWARGKALNHHGSNTMNFFSVWLAPKTGLSFAVACNAAGGPVPDRMEDVCSALVRRYGSV